MKRYIHLFSIFLIIVTLLCCTAMPISADVQEEAKTRTVMVQIYVQNGVSIAQNEYVDVYFENTVTDETFQFSIKANNSNFPIELPQGEYKVAKATLTDRPEVAFQTSIGKLVVDDSENIYFTLSLKNVLTTEENEEEVKNSINEFEKEKLNDILFAGGLLLWFVLGITSLVCTIRGRITKNDLLSDVLRARAKITGHLFFSLVCGYVLGSLFGDSGDFSWFGGILGFGFPFGLVAVGIFGPSSDAIIQVNSEGGSTSGFWIAILFFASLIFGVILAPVVLIRDIIRVITATQNYKKRSYAT